MTLQTSLTAPITTQIWSRKTLIQIINTALIVGETRFARQTAQNWLASYPGDLEIRYLLAKAWLAEGNPNQAAAILRNLVQADPEFMGAQTKLADIGTKPGFEADEAALRSVLALGGFPPTSHPKGIPEKSLTWSKSVQKTRDALAESDLKGAENHLQGILTTEPINALGAITHLQTLRAQETTPGKALHNLAEYYQQCWPDCIQFILILAETLMDSGDADQAVSLLHKAVTKDVNGQVALRLWGADHPYRSLWPENLEALISAQIPAAVAAYSGWNLLNEGKNGTQKTPPSSWVAEHAKTILVENDNSHQDSLQWATTEAHDFDFFQDQPEIPEGKDQGESTPQPEPGPNDQNPAESPFHQTEVLKSVKDELARIARRVNRPDLSETDGRFPVYVIFSNRKGLERKFGAETTQIIDAALYKLVAAIRKRLDWGAAVVYADDATSMAQFGLDPLAAVDAWQLKLVLADLDAALGKRGARIGAVLLIGGHEIVPFHLLPNPTDDADSNVPSDNPYTTRDENYFIPDWPVGRLPGGRGKDPGLLISSLRSMIKRHSAPKPEPRNWLIRLLDQIFGRFRAGKNLKSTSFGYSAEAWREASVSVYKLIGDPRTLITSPPVEINGNIPLPPTDLGYFNLHGVADSPEWFGQRDTTDPSGVEIGEGIDYPTALDPKDVQNGGRAPQVVFSEACYGAHILNKSIEEALSLKFLSSGSQAVVGSTVISYGSVTPPLNAADHLAQSFWKNLQDGRPVGEALMLAKITLVSNKHNRQGYLDGEDQKTLISFVLYGDPLTTIKELKSQRIVKTKSGDFNPPSEIKTICDRVAVPGTSEPISKDMIKNVKNVVEQYLPGMRNAQLSLSHTHAECSCQGHTCPTHQLGSKSKPTHDPEHQVVTLSKQIVHSHRVHETYARVTFDKQGKLVKLAVSR